MIYIIYGFYVMYRHHYFNVDAGLLGFFFIIVGVILPLSTVWNTFISF